MFYIKRIYSILFTPKTEETEEEKIKKYEEKHIYRGPVNFGTLEKQIIWKERLDKEIEKRKESKGLKKH